MDADAPPQEAQDRSATWCALMATERGAAHVAVGLPNQDAAAAYPMEQYGAVAAVADGHGHHRHFRSARGSRLAVAVACQAAAELTERLDRFEAAGQIKDEARQVLVPAIAGRWRTAVSQDLAAEPFTPEEEALRAVGDEPVIAYGSTLLLAVAWRHWLVLAQIGDGDIVGVRPGGSALLPVPGDPALDGRQTTSLCEPRAENAFRIAVVDLSRTALLAVMLATDGYGNAQLADPWAERFSKDLAELLPEHDLAWLADQLPLWAGRCASSEGSADDTTIALLLAPAGTGSRPATEKSTVPADDTLRSDSPTATLPADSLTATLPASPTAAPARDATIAPPALAPPGGRRRRRRAAGFAVAALVAVAAVVGVAIWLLSPAAAVRASCTAAKSPANGTVVRGNVITACATGTHRQVTVPTSGLPKGEKIEVQGDGFVFVLVGSKLSWKLYWTLASQTTTAARWPALTSVTGSTPRLCRAGGDVVVDAAASAGKPAGSWAQLRVNPAKDPPVVAGRQNRAGPLCPGGVAR
jgi:hypothetical protein